jgi:hypothetical protein
MRFHQQGQRHSRPRGPARAVTFRLRDGCSASTWTAPDGSSLLTLDASSVQTDPDGSRRIQKDRLDDQTDDQAS